MSESKFQAGQATLGRLPGWATSLSPGRIAAELWRRMAPFAALIAILIVIFELNPAASSYTGLSLLLAYAIPLMLAATAQMFIIAAGDIDLGIGSFIGLINALSVTLLARHPGFGALALAGCVLAYAFMGVFVHLRGLPGIVVTLSAGFVWLGIAIFLLPTPGGAAPSWLAGILGAQVPFVPLPIVIAVVLALVVHLLVFRTSYGAILRGAGGNPRAVARMGWSLLGTRAALYGLAGLFGVLAGLAVTGVTTSGDANVGASYTLLSIASVILGGGEFGGGRISAVGAVVGAITLSLVGTLLAFLNVSSDYQIGVQGVILLAVLAARAFDRRRRG
ncbi:MAG: ABC transporter permease [Streptosporangiaceae bacterium]